MSAIVNEHTQYVNSNGIPFANGLLYIGEVLLDPVINPITIYADRDLTTTLDNPQTLDSDGRATNKIYVPGRYSLQVNDELAVQAYQDLNAGNDENVVVAQVRMFDSTASVSVATSIGGDLRFPFSGTIFEVGAYCDVAGTGDTTLDMNLAGTTIMTTNKIVIGTTETSSLDFVTQPTLTTTAYAKDQIITRDVDSIGGVAIQGLVAWIKLLRTGT